MERCFLGSFLLLNLFQNVFTLTILPKAVCFLQRDAGRCNDYQDRFYYNTLTQTCEKFSYGGCEGNANNFMSSVMCIKTCFTIPKVPKICRFPKETGPCRAMILRYFFNMTSMQCEEFDYGGCMGNENKFLNKKSCTNYCNPPKSFPIICTGAANGGGCSASIPRYYYNAIKSTCEEFTYTGCGGNNNNFVSMQNCMNVCVKRNRQKKPKRMATSEFLQRIV